MPGAITPSTFPVVVAPKKLHVAFFVFLVLLTHAQAYTHKACTAYTAPVFDLEMESRKIRENKTEKNKRKNKR